MNYIAKIDIYNMSDSSSPKNPQGYQCDWKVGLKIYKGEQVVYETNNPIIKGSVAVVGATTAMGMIVGAGVGFATPFYGAGRLLLLGGKAVMRM